MSDRQTIRVELDSDTHDRPKRTAADLGVSVEQLAGRLLAGAAAKLDGTLDGGSLTEGGNYRRQ